jgi:hypothetical protein
MADLGATGNVLNALTGDSSAAAEEAVLGWAHAVGSFHAATVGRRDQFDAVRKHLGPIEDNTVPPNYGAAFADMCAKVGVQISTDAEAEGDGVASIPYDRGPFDALTPGDTCLDNNMRTSSGWKLLDFEFARFRNALLDVSYLRSLLPTCWGVGRIPIGLIQQAEALYLETLKPACPEAADSLLFSRELVEACAYWVAEPFVKWFMPKALDEDWERGYVTVRQRIITRFDVFSEMTREFSYMTALGDASGASRSRDRCHASQRLSDEGDFPLRLTRRHVLAWRDLSTTRAREGTTSSWRRGAGHGPRKLHAALIGYEFNDLKNKRHPPLYGAEAYCACLSVRRVVSVGYDTVYCVSQLRLGLQDAADVLAPISVERSAQLKDLASPHVPTA